jgi:hypothetical protein
VLEPRPPFSPAMAGNNRFSKSDKTFRDKKDGGIKVVLKP